jgi:hypothetical protein
MTTTTTTTKHELELTGVMMDDVPEEQSVTLVMETFETIMLHREAGGNVYLLNRVKGDGKSPLHALHNIFW